MLYASAVPIILSIALLVGTGQEADIPIKKLIDERTQPKVRSSCAEGERWTGA